MSLRIQNFESEILKVNDANGNPVEVAAVVVWRVLDTAKAAFEVQDYEGFVKIQTETAIDTWPREYPYDAYRDGDPSLRANADEVTASLHHELQDQLLLSGVEVMRTQLRRLAYAPEIAADMLRRQQAEAVVAARQRIVEGAVGMVDHALEMLSEQGKSSNSTKSARPPWSPTCWWCSAASTRCSRCSTRAPSTSDDHWQSARPSSYESIPRCTPPWRSGPLTSYAVSTARSSSC